MRTSGIKADIPDSTTFRSFDSERCAGTESVKQFPREGVSLAEISAVTLPLGLTIELNVCFEGCFPLTMSLPNARAKIEAWLRNYKESRPHTALGWLTPVEYAVSAGVDPGRCRPETLAEAG